MSVTTSIALDKRPGRTSQKKNVHSETKSFQACIRVTFNRQPRPFPVGIELTEDEFRKLSSPRLGEKLREIKENLEKHHERAQTIIKNLNKFSFQAFSEQFNAFLPGQRRKKTQEKTLAGDGAKIAKDAAPLTCTQKPRENFVNQFGGRKYPRKRSEIDFQALGEVAVYYGQYITKLEAKDQAGTIGNYLSSLMSLLEYKPQLRFADITDVWLYQYEKHMKSKGRSTTTISFYTRCLRRIFNIVIAKKIIDRDLYPFGRDLYVVPGGRKRKKALKMPDIQTLFEHKCDNETEQMCKDLWFFMYVGNGMNVKDMCLLRFGQISDRFCRFIRAKTINTTKEDPQEITFFCDDFILEIIARWGNKDQRPQNFIFPFLTEGLDGYGLRDKVQLVTSLINKHMKHIADTLDIEKLPTTNDARHAFATLLKRAGKSTEFIRELIGHENEKTTRNYLDDFEDDVKTDIAETLLPFRNLPTRSKILLHNERR